MNLTITPAMRDNPYPYYAMARQMAPVVFNDAINMWNLFLYEDVRAVLRNPAVFSSDPSRYFPNMDQQQQSMLTTDPPRHTQLRNLVNVAFTPRRVAGLEPRIAAIANELLDQAIAKGGMDIVDDLSTPLPVIIIAELLGIPPEDRALFKHWSDIIAARLGTDFRGEPPAEILQIREEFAAYFDEQIEAHRREPKDDLIGALLGAEIDGRKLTSDELLSFCILLLVAGNETTTNLIGNAVRLLLEHPDQLLRLREEPALMPAAVEEVLRYRSPVQATIRFATEDTEIGGKQIQAGQRAVLWIGSANHDPGEFPDPERFEIARQPNRHLSFGLGIHFCLGAPLARLEAKVALETLLRRVPQFERAGSDPYEPVDGYIMHGVKHLPLTLSGV